MGNQRIMQGPLDQYYNHRSCKEKLLSMSLSFPNKIQQDMLPMKDWMSERYFLKTDLPNCQNRQWMEYQLKNLWNLKKWLRLLWKKVKGCGNSKKFPNHQSLTTNNLMAKIQRSIREIALQFTTKEKNNQFECFYLMLEHQLPTSLMLLSQEKLLEKDVLAKKLEYKFNL